MKHNELKGITRKASGYQRNYQIIMRLDESLPLETEDWRPIERLLIHLTEFAPSCLLADLSHFIAVFADDQARRAYILGQEDLCAELEEKAA